MPSSAAAGDAETIWVYAILGGVVANKANGAMNIGLDFGDGEFGLGAVNDGKNGVAVVQQGFEEERVDGFMRRNPPAADHQGDADAVGLLRLEDIERQSGSGFA